MRERINKPRVFLSHARKDVEFIERIERDLRRCQIEPWRDINEIRDGEPWQNVIFAEGIPACDVVITYYTENSIASQMVSKEVDSALLRQLSDNGIGFLPYVNTDQTRNNLRLDIQVLQCRVWNDDNYNEVLPSVVAEIWRRYTERAIPLAIAMEKSKRLELELEVKNLQARMSASAFTPQEENEFQYIFTKLKEPRIGVCNLSADTLVNRFDKTAEITKCRVKYPFIKGLYERIRGDSRYFGDSFLDILFLEVDNIEPFASYLRKNMRFWGLVDANGLASTLKIHELLDAEAAVFSNKMYRFVSWLEYRNKIENEPPIEFIEFVDEPK